MSDHKRFNNASAAPIVVKRKRVLLTENTPLDAVAAYEQSHSASTSSSRATQRITGAYDHDDEEEFLSSGIREGQATIRDERFEDYQREDGRKGEVGGVGSADTYNIEYMGEYARRLEVLQQHPDFAFAFLVLGFLNGDVFEILDKDVFQREVERDVARAREEVRKQLTRAESVEAQRKSIAELEKQLKITNTDIELFEKRENTWDSARKKYLDAKTSVDQLLALNERFSTRANVTNEDYEAVAAARKLPKEDLKLFDVLARVAFMKYGPSGLLKQGFAADIETSFRSYCIANYIPEKLDARFGNNVGQNMQPLVVEIPLYLAALKALVNTREILLEIARTLVFDKSDYKDNPSLFADDVYALAQLVIPDYEEGQVAGPATFKRISLLFWAHINQMIRRSGRAEDDLVLKPSEFVEDAGGVAVVAPRGTRQKKILGNVVDVNVEDERLQSAAIGDKTVFTAEELAVYKKQKFKNAEPEKTMRGVARLLRPLFIASFGRLFFIDGSVDLYEESRYPVERPQSVRNVYRNVDVTNYVHGSSVASLFSYALILLEMSARDFYYKKADNRLPDDTITSERAEQTAKEFKEKLIEENDVGDGWRRYERHLRDMLVRRRMLLFVAQLLDLMSGRVENSDNVGIQLSDAEFASLRAYLLDPEKSPAWAAIIDIYDTSIPRVQRAPPEYVLQQSVLTESSFEFNQLLEKYKKIEDPYNKRLMEVEKNTIETRLKEFRDRLHTVLTRSQEDERREIEKNLGIADVSRRWASMPFNSGILVLSNRFRSCLREATKLVHQHVPNLRNWTSEQLQRTEATQVDFAKLVATKILIVNATNPGQYLRDNTIPDLRVQLRDCVDSLRSIGGRRGAICSGFGTAVASSRPVVPLRNYGHYFV